MSCENERREKGESREEKCCVGMGEGNNPHVRVREWDGEYEEYSRIVWMESDCVEEHWVHPDGHCVNCSMTLWSLNNCGIYMTETLWCYIHSPMTKSMIDTAIENRWNPMHQWHHHPYADSNTKAKSQIHDRLNCVSKPMNWHVAYLKSSVSIP